ncbi:MAG TPA: SDR family oxidoreductase [Acidimicrobiia bacterium]|jgi:NAD(P)-dependent dehydrogenase (short-subunit alcohol dehydrogenase family)
MSGTLEGKVAVVTGASKGIGRAIAGRLADEGADCVLAARSAVDLEMAASEIRAHSGRRVAVVPVDLRTAEGCAALHDAATSAFDRVDVLVNCAGATKPGGLLDVDDDTWEDGFALKFFGTVRVCRLFWPDLAASHGTVVNVVGGLARTPAPDILVGGAVNAALANFTKALAGQGLRDDVNVNAVHPGQTMTERFEMLLTKRAEAAGVTRDEFLDQTTQRQGVRRLGRPEDVAGLVAFLCTPEARHIQGVSVAVDGGGTSGLF